MGTSFSFGTESAELGADVSPVVFLSKTAIVGWFVEVALGAFVSVAVGVAEIGEPLGELVLVGAAESDVGDEDG